MGHLETLDTQQITIEEYLFESEKIISSDFTIVELLQRLGITSNYKGYFQTITAVRFAVEHPESLTMVTKLLYPEVAHQYNTRWADTERVIRTVVGIAWNKNADMLEAIAHHKLTQKPHVSQFIAILAAYISAQENKY